MVVKIQLWVMYWTYNIPMPLSKHELKFCAITKFCSCKLEPDAHFHWNSNKELFQRDRFIYHMAPFNVQQLWMLSHSNTNVSHHQHSLLFYAHSILVISDLIYLINLSLPKDIPILSNPLPASSMYHLVSPTPRPVTDIPFHAHFFLCHLKLLIHDFPQS